MTWHNENMLAFQETVAVIHNRDSKYVTNTKKLELDLPGATYTNMD